MTNSIAPENRSSRKEDLANIDFQGQAVCFSESIFRWVKMLRSICKYAMHSGTLQKI